MKLRFYAATQPDGFPLMASVPRVRRVIGQAARYVGRELVLDGEAATWPATKEPQEFKADSPKVPRLLLQAKRGDIWPADTTTAEFCGIPKPDVTFKDGAWTLKPTKATSLKGVD